MLASFLVLLLTGHSSAQQSKLSQIDTAKIDQFFDRLAQKNKAMGSLVVTKDGEILYSRAIGYGQITATVKQPLTAASRFRIGSITKMFTATMILQLVEEGKLQLTDTLDKFLPQVQNATKMTIGQILVHRSGIPNVKRVQNAQGNINTLPLTNEEHLALIVNSAPDFAPGAKQSYSNSGYFLLGLVLEKITAQPYPQALHERIVARLGLSDTYLTTSNIDPQKHEALTYIHFGSDWKPVTETHPTILFSAGAIVSTPADLAKFIHALFTLKLVSQASLNHMTTTRDGDPFAMLEPFTFAGKTFYGHTGGADNYGAWLAYDPQEKLAVAYTTNAKIYPVGKIVSGVVDICYHQPFQIPALESLVVSPAVLDRYVGAYSLPGAPAKAWVTRDGATLFFQPPGEAAAVPLEASAEDKFQIEGVAVFEFDAAKKQLTIKRRGGERIFTKE